MANVLPIMRWIWVVLLIKAGICGIVSPDVYRLAKGCNNVKHRSASRGWQGIIRSTLIMVFVVVVAAIASMLVWVGLGPAPTVRENTNPMANKQFYVDPQRDAVRAAYDARQSGKMSDGDLLDRIAQQPGATWLTGASNDPSEMRRVSGAAGAVNKVALVVAYNIPYRDCGGNSSGGATSGDAYRNWLSSVADAVVGPVVVIVEPDAIANLAHNCVTGDRAKERANLLAEAVKTFKHQKLVLGVYLDAANPGWFPNQTALIAALRQSGVQASDGVSVNVSNFFDTATVTQWSEKLVGALNSARAKYGVIIDTSRNGNGAYTGDQEWCNPPGRALGDVPTTDTGNAAIHAYAWVKVPGDSDGTCRNGPPAGTFWPEYALGLALGNS